MSDIDEFLEITKNYASNDKLRTQPSLSPGEVSPEKQDPTPIPGKLVQYSLHGQGYKATTATVSTLPAGQYEINIDMSGIFVAPLPVSNSLLLELPEMRSEEVIGLIENFWASEKDYKEGNQFVIGGAAFKAGIMLFGEPGTGKSCTIKLVSKKLIERGGTVFFASTTPGIINTFLNEFSQIEPNRKCIVILEDFESLIYNFGESGYLEMLDSAKSIDNVLFIATTNYPDRLDPRIYNRPGRFSHVVKIGLPGKAAREAFLKAILKNHRDIPYIVEYSEGYSIDHLSALCNSVYREKKELRPEMERLRKLFKMPKIDSGNKIGI